MTGVQAKELLKALTDYYTALNPNFKSPLSNSETVTELYTDTLITFKFFEGKNAIVAIMKNETYFPSIGKINKQYEEEIKKINQAKKFEEKKKTNCIVCEGNGFIIKYRAEGDILTYCTRCKAGEEWKYDGRKCQNKSPYFARPISYYNDITNLEKEGNKTINITKIFEKIREFKSNVKV